MAGGQQSTVPTDAAGMHADEQVSSASGDERNPHIKKGSEADVSSVGKRNMGRRGLHNWYSAQWERDTGLQYSMQIEKSLPLATDPVVVAYVDRVGQRLVRNSDARGPFTIKVLDSDEVNAMALPGGHLYVTKGLILECQSEDELAGAIAHEIAHVAAHHAAREMTQMEYVQLSAVPMVLLAQGSLAGYGLYEATQLALPMPLLEFSRKYETEADYLGAQYMYKAGYDPQGMVKVLERLAALQKHKPGAVARSFAGHPATAEREAAVEREIKTILPPKSFCFNDASTQAEFNAVKARLQQAGATYGAAAATVAQKN
jgi:predicted Zn-dependent protease